MKITLAPIDGDESITLSNEDHENDNFIDLSVGEYEYTVSVDELLSALTAFEEERRRRLEREKHYPKQYGESAF